MVEDKSLYFEIHRSLKVIVFRNTLEFERQAPAAEDEGVEKATKGATKQGSRLMIVIIHLQSNLQSNVQLNLQSYHQAGAHLGF